MERAYAAKQTALEGQSFKYLDIFERQLLEHKLAQKEFYDTKDQEDKENEKNKPAYFRDHKLEPRSSDANFDEGKPLSKKAEDSKAWKNL